MFEFNKEIRQDRFDQKIKHLAGAKNFLKAETKIRIENKEKIIRLKDCFVNVELAKKFMNSYYEIKYFTVISGKKYELDKTLFKAIDYHYCNMKYIGKTIKIGDGDFIRTMPYDNIKDELLLKYVNKIIDLSNKSLNKLATKLFGKPNDTVLKMHIQPDFIEFKNNKKSISFDPFAIHFVSKYINESGTGFLKMENSNKQNLNLANFMIKTFGQEYINDRIEHYKAQKAESIVYYSEPNKICYNEYLIELNEKLITKNKKHRILNIANKQNQEVKAL